MCNVLKHLILSICMCVCLLEVLICDRTRVKFSLKSSINCGAGNACMQLQTNSMNPVCVSEKHDL